MSWGQVFAGNLYGTGSGGYSTWLNFDKDSADQVNDDPRRHDYNADMRVAASTHSSRIPLVYESG